MRCGLCKVETVRRRATATSPFRYEADSLVAVLLHHIDIRRCPLCGRETVDLPARRVLHDAIADAIVREPGRLKGSQIRYLRRHARLPAWRFSALLGVDPAHLSRVENGKIKSLGVSADRLARLLTAVTGGKRVLRGLISDLADAERAADPASRAPMAFKWWGGRTWKRAG